MINSTYDEEAVLDNTTADATATVDTTTATVEAEPTSRLPRWLRAPQPKPLRPQKEVDKLYPRLRFQVFIGIFIGYASFYLIRNNVSLVANTLSENGLSKTDIGIIANCLLLAYGFSKFFAATISDRANARFFMPLGLILSGLTNILIGISADGTISVSIFAVLMTINGIFQGMGWPPAGRVMVHWFSTSERGGKMALWNIAHNVGGALSGALVAYALDHFGSDNWASAFWFPAVICFILAIITFFLVRDNPQSMGLPSIEEYHNDPAPVEIDEADKTESTWQTIRRHILRNPTMVYLAFANVFVYTLRYGIVSWAPLYLAQVRGGSTSQGIAGFSIFEISGIIGTLLCGWISDRVFKGRRSVTGIVFMVGVILAVLLYWLPSNDAPMWVSWTALALAGGLIYGPVMLIGLQALDMSPTHIAGTAAGFTGLFGYVLGATMASTGIGAIAQHMGWGAAFIFLIICAVLSIVLLGLVDRKEKEILAKARAKRDAVRATQEENATAEETKTAEAELES